MQNTQTATQKVDYKIELRHVTMNDYEDLWEAMQLAYANIEEPNWTKKELEILMDKFPMGQLCVLVNNKAVAAAFSLVVDYAKFGDNHTYKQITGNYTFSTHTNKGDVLYGIDVFVHPDYRGLRLARRLYDARKELCENLNLRAIIAGGRIPNYSKHEEKLTPKEYIESVKTRDIFDPVLTFQLSNGFHVKKILRNYLALDGQSKSFATLLEWHNIYYEDDVKLIKNNKSVVRLGMVQLQMRPVSSLDKLFEQMEFFIDALSAYQTDFIMFPEFFNAPLMARYNELEESAAIRSLATYTIPVRDKFVEFAVSYNVNIITGSMPFLDTDKKLYNIAYLCRRDGTWEAYRKVHITPNEASTWGMVGGNEIKVFDTDCGKIGILICYDVEFPELPRFLADQGMQILFVPFMTDTQNGYTRVRRCAQARAIENECYVAITGSVGNLPRVANMDIQYAQSAVFSPSDFAFPKDAIIAEATPNTEMTLIADVNIDLLLELHEQGSVQTLKDRRKDLYQLVRRTPK